MKTDFHYHADSTGFFYTVWPNNQDAENALNEWMKQNDCSNHVFMMHFPNFKAGLKSAGYTIRKVKPAKNTMSDSDILKAFAE